MKRILTSTAFTAIMCLINTAYVTDIEVDQNNLNPIHSTNQKAELSFLDQPDYSLALYICQQLPYKDVKTLSKINKYWYRVTKDERISSQQFHKYGFTVNNVHNHHELETLTDAVYNKSNQAINNYIKEHDRHIQKHYMNRHTEFDLSWLAHERSGQTLTWVENLYKTDLGGLKASCNNIILDSVAKLMNCETDKILHIRNDMVFDNWRTYKLNNLDLIQRYNDTWQDNKYDINYIQTLTLTSHNATLDIWQEDAMSINRSTKNRKDLTRNFRKANQPNASFRIKRGATLCISPYVEFSLTHESGSLDKISVLVNEYARYDKKLEITSIKFPKIYR